MIKTHFTIDDAVTVKIPHRITTWLFDPPYNIGFRYSKNVNDNLTKDDYSKFISQSVENMFNHTKDNGSLFIIHYPDIISRLIPLIEDSGWILHQWITWVYPSNIGHSKKRFTKASRCVLWFVKGEPKINIRAITQPFKNPNDKRIKVLIANGQKGVALYDYWEINMRKNVSKGYAGWFNQLPFELVKRIILVSSDENDWIGDLVAGGGTLLEVGLAHNRNVLQNDIDSKALVIWNSVFKTFIN
jgi:DNA modification methylase